MYSYIAESSTLLVIGKIITTINYDQVHFQDQNLQ